MEKLITSPEIVLIEEIKNRLESQGIHSEIIEDNNTFISASGEITKYSLLVRQEDLPTALNIKNEIEHERTSEEVTPWCAKCGCEDVSKEVIVHRRSSIIYLILAPILLALGLIGGFGIIFNWCFIAGGILFFIQYFIGHKEKVYTCNKCGHKFRRP